MKRARGSIRALPPDWSAFIALLGKHRVRCLIVGAHALAAHGRPRFTGDLDLWVEPSRANAARVGAALEAFGFGGCVSLRWLAKPETGWHGLQLGVEPYRIDLLKGISGVRFATAWRRRLRTTLENQTVYIIGRADYLRNKRASARAKDLLDIELLKEIDS